MLKKLCIWLIYLSFTVSRYICFSLFPHLIFRWASFFCSASSDHYNSDLSCYFHELKSPLFLQCSKCKFNSDAQEFPLCRIVPSGRFPEHFNPDLFRSWGSIIAYPHNLHFLQTPPLISHTLSFITISIVNLYLWAAFEPCIGWKILLENLNSLGFA